MEQYYQKEAATTVKPHWMEHVLFFVAMFGISFILWSLVLENKVVLL